MSLHCASDFNSQSSSAMVLSGGEGLAEGVAGPNSLVGPRKKTRTNKATMAPKDLRSQCPDW
jgi:hypothetical protein